MSSFAIAASAFLLAQTGAAPLLIGDGGPATSSWIQCESTAVDASGNLFIVAQFTNRVRKVTPAGIISTVAGTGKSGFSGDGGPAISALLNGPQGVAVDQGGNLFIADSNNNRVRKITPNGVISTVAGNGLAGFSGDGGPATAAQLRQPFSVAADSAGNLFVGTLSNVRKISPAGLISTVAGNASSGFSGDGGPAGAAQVGEVLAIALDNSGSIFIAGDWRIRKISPNGIISTITGNGPPGEPIRSVAVDAVGNLFVAIGSEIRRITPAGAGSTVAGSGSRGYSGDGGPAARAQLSNPSGLAFDNAGSLFVADRLNNRVRKITADGIIRTVAGNGADGPSALSLNLPMSIAIDATGNLFVSEQGANRVRKITVTGAISTVAGSGIRGFSGDGGPAVSAQLAAPSGLVLDNAGNLLIVDYLNNRVRKVTAAGIIDTLTNIPAVRNQPSGLAVDAAGNLYIADRGDFRIRKVTPAGTVSIVAGDGTPGFSGDGGPALAAQILGLSGVAVDGVGNLFITDVSRIRKVTPDGIIRTVAGSGSHGFSGDGGPATAAQLNIPFSVAVDKAGNLFIADTNNNRIRKVSVSGIITTAVGNGTMDLGGDGGAAVAAAINTPYGVAVDAAGNLYVADTGNNRIRRVTADGIINTFAGN